MKKIWLLPILALLLAGCESPVDPEYSLDSSAESTFSVESTVEHSSSPGEISLPEELFTSSEEEISLPVTPDPVTLEGILVFTFPEGWAQSGEETLFAVSPDGNASVQGTFTSLETTKGLTEELLAASAAPALKEAWEARGITGVSADVTESTLGGIPCFAVSLQGVSHGTAVFPWQAYLLTEEGFLTITITTTAEDKRQELAACFSGV